MSLTTMSTLLLIMLFGLGLAAWGLNGAFIRRLAVRHPSVWEELGSPSMFWNASPKASSALSALIWSTRYRELEDPQLNRLGNTLRAGTILILVVLLAEIGLFLILRLP
jgi:hypothetical protein